MAGTSELKRTGRTSVLGRGRCRERLPAWSRAIGSEGQSVALIGSMDTRWNPIDERLDRTSKREEKQERGGMICIAVCSGTVEPLGHKTKGAGRQVKYRHSIRLY